MGSIRIQVLHHFTGQLDMEICRLLKCYVKEFKTGIMIRKSQFKRLNSVVL